MLMVDMHDPISANANEFQNEGQRHGSVRFTCKRGDHLTLFTTPEAAFALAEAFNAAIKPKQEDAS